jgi:hypothetical protein
MVTSLSQNPFNGFIVAHHTDLVVGLRRFIGDPKDDSGAMGTGLSTVACRLEFTIGWVLRG